jgi:hypothetical protein
MFRETSYRLPSSRVKMASVGLRNRFVSDSGPQVLGRLPKCDGCRAALDQFQTVIHLVSRLTPTDVARIDALTHDRLMATLRAARRR